MALKDFKLTESDFSGNDISSLPDRPSDAGITTAQLKARFDMIGKAVLGLGRINGIIETLISKVSGNSGADNIGISPVAGTSGETVQAVMGELAEATAQATEAANTAAAQGSAAEQAANTAAQAAANAVETAARAEEAAVIATEQGADAAEAARLATDAVIEVKTYAEEKAQEAKDYVDSVVIGAGAVTSVFGRGGEVKAQAGDYTAEMVGAIAADQKGAANGVAILDSTGKVPSGQLPSMDYIPTSEKGAAGGVASLGSDGKVPESQLPALGSTNLYGTEEYVDKVTPLADGVAYFMYEE